VGRVVSEQVKLLQDHFVLALLRRDLQVQVLRLWTIKLCRVLHLINMEGCKTIIWGIQYKTWIILDRINLLNKELDLRNHLQLLQKIEFVRNHQWAWKLIMFNTNNNPINLLKQFQTNKKTKLWRQGSRDLFQINSLKLTNNDINEIIKIIII
jgi:hypothetical protein